MKKLPILLGLTACLLLAAMCATAQTIDTLTHTYVNEKGKTVKVREFKQTRMKVSNAKANRMLENGDTTLQRVLVEQFHESGKMEQHDWHTIPVKRTKLRELTDGKDLYDVPVWISPLNPDYIGNRRMIWRGDSATIDLVYLGDGYTASEENKFYADVDAISAKFFECHPLSAYKHRFAVHAVFKASAVSGAKHPGSASDCYTANPAVPVSTAVTYFGATFDYGGTHRLLYCTNTTAINGVLQANTPWYDKAMIIVNSPYYGGSGGNYSIGSVHPSSAEIMIHEFGHSFAGLADEYGGSYCTGLEKPNVTKETDRSKIKWRHRIKPTTPIPTPANTNCGDEGLYNSANYCSNGWYRPCCDCKMRTLNQPLCDVCKDEFVLKILSYPVNPDSIKGSTPQPPVKPVVKINNADVFTASVTVPGTVTLTASGAQTYLWSTGETTAAVVKAPASHTVYGVIGTSKGLSDTAYANITVTQPPTTTSCTVNIEPVVWFAQSCTLRIQTTKAFADYEFCHNVQKVPYQYNAAGQMLYNAWLCQTATTWQPNYQPLTDNDPNVLTVLVKLRWPHAMYKQQIRVREKACALTTAVIVNTP